MIAAVFDCGILISAIAWGGNPANALALVAVGQAQAIVSDDIWREYEKRIPEVLAQRRPEAKSEPLLAWLLTVARFVTLVSCIPDS